MTLQNLYFFSEIVKDMNLGVTAERLFISQQALSGHIKRLETHFGVRLFERKPNLVLTREGVVLKREAQIILNAERRLFIEYGTGLAQQHGHMRVASGVGRSKIYLPGTISRFSAKYPLVMISCEDENKYKTTNMFENGDVDIAVGRHMTDMPGIKHELLFKTYSCVVVSDALLRKHMGADTDAFLAESENGIEISRLPSEIPMAHTGLPGQEHWLCTLIPELRNLPRVYINAGNPDMLLGICREGRAMVLISDLFCRSMQELYSPAILSGLIMRPMLLGGRRVYENEELSYSINQAHPQYFFDFIDILKQTLAEKQLLGRGEES